MCFSFCFPAVLPLRVLNFYAEAANYTHPTTEDHRNRITLNTSVSPMPACLPPPPLEDKRPHWGNPQSCLLHMSSRTQHTGGIHKAVSCICNSNIQGCGTLGGLHPVLTISTSSRQRPGRGTLGGLHPVLTISTSSPPLLMS